MTRQPRATRCFARSPAASDPLNRFNLTVSEIDSTSPQLKALRTETYRNLSMQKGSPSYALDVVNDGSALIQLERDVGWTSTLRPVATGTIGTTPTKIPPEGATFKVGTASPPTLVCTLKYKGAVPAASDFPALRPFLEDAIHTAAAAASPPDPLLTGAVVQLIGKGTAAAPYQFVVLAGRGGSAFKPESTIVIDAAGADTTAADLGLKAATVNVQQYALGKAAVLAQSDPKVGVDDDTLTANDIKGTRSAKSGMYALEEVDLFNLLCLPAAAKLDATNAAAVYSEALAYCEEKRAFLLVDIPENIATPVAMQTWMSQNDTLRNKNAAVYFPRPMIPNPLNDNRLRNVGASGTLAGLFAKTDASRGVWKAPAGVEAKLVNVQDLGYVLTDPENGTLNPLGINCLRRFPIYGHVSWGARTLDGADQQASEWKYVPVRRLALFLEESLYRGTKWVVFEPNDEPLWAQIRLNVGAFMHNLFRQGAFQGKTPREAYLVKCDKETTTQNDIDLGIVNILVGFAPLKPAEFVIIKIQQLAGQIEV